MHTQPLAIAALTAVLFSSPAISQDKAGAHSGMHASQSSEGKMNHAVMESSPNAAKAPFDLQFLDTMSAHH